MRGRSRLFGRVNINPHADALTRVIGKTRRAGLAVVDVRDAVTVDTPLVFLVVSNVAAFNVDRTRLAVFARAIARVPTCRGVMTDGRADDRAHGGCRAAPIAMSEIV